MATSARATATAAAATTPSAAATAPYAAATAPSAAAYSMDGDLTVVQDGAGPITTPAAYDIQTTLDAWSAQLDALLAAPLTPANAWLKVPVDILNMFFVSWIVADNFSHMLNGMATLLDEVVPPFKMVDGAPSTITQASVTAAVLAGAITLLNTSQTIDIPHWIAEAVSLAGALQDIAANPVVNGLTANDLDGVIGAARSAFLAPKNVLDMTVDIGPAPNPVSLVMYVVVVAIFRRFADVATDHQPVVTDMQQTSQHLPNGSGTTVSGYVQFYDPDGDPITSFGFTEPNDSRFTVTVVDGTNGRMNWTVWDWNPLSSDKSPKTLTFTMTVLAQGDGQISVSKPYMPNGNETKKTVTVTVYYNQAIGSVSTTVDSTSALGVVRGSITSPQNPDNPTTYSLSGASGGSAYTANGGIVKLNPATGAYTYIPNRASSATSDSFQVVSTDSFGHTDTTTVTVPVSTASPVTNINTATLGQVTGNLNISGSDSGLMTYSLGNGPNPARGTVTVNSDGSFTYIRTAAGHTQPTPDSFTILGTDSTGKTVTIATVNVTPQVANSAPVITQTTTNVGATGDSAKWGLNTSTWTQTTSGKITTTDADGDTLTYSLVDPSTHAAVATTTNGGTVTFDADGTYHYTITKNQAYFHGAAKQGATGTAVNDSFTVAVSDGYGGTAYTTVTMAIYAVNSAPTFTNENYTTSFFGSAKTVWLLHAQDADGDTIGTNRGGTPGYDTSNNKNVTGNLDVGGASLGYGSGTLTITLRDGYYFVDNGIVRTDGSGNKVLASYSKTWT
ncbi:Ig-like domain-containing protein [Mycobacterium sp. CVI_P3]|uniref:Ig-like domain-containing protein n=1 Tax=Mycobacterium pinniadriaticum TaxID=2994102 RepID=A0ABT3SAZ3_9MYCO|nr:Ig-like domain-containing protein [Mycobacterium pinniadriaticum]MCX2930275.1 Ig-like domain-containing protein [Mycobacterium pinniadriaticum]MCX2936663.1 Ig-like domain-containing protein [Mycobacterium pinniadriaticum]